jgi:hypothetical protein
MKFFWAFFFLCNTAFATDSTTSVLSVPEVLKNKLYEDTSEITDNKLRADAGSLSRYSLKFNLTYAGPTLGDLSEKDQPNPDGSIGSYATSLGGSLGARYRFDAVNSVSLSSGVKALYPLHGMERFDLSNPSFTLEQAHRAMNTQMRTSEGFILRTVPEFKAVGQYGYLLLNQSMVYDLGTSPWAIGSDFGFGYFLYDRDYRASDKKSARYSLEVNPNFKYRFSDRMDLNTAIGFSVWNPRARGDQYALLNKAISQKIGFGYGSSRDFYIQPYLNFYPQDLQWDLVTFNILTSFSIF